jgi:hypothetical protein
MVKKLSSAVILRSEPPGTHDHILLSQTRDSFNLEGQVPVIIFLRNRVTQLYPQTLGSLFAASYDSQGYGGGIRTCLHAGNEHSSASMLPSSLGADRKGNTAYDSSYSVAYVYLYLFIGRSLATAVSIGSVILALRGHVSVL